MPSPLGLLRHTAQNGARLLRLGVARSVLRPGFWLRVRLQAPLEEARPALVWPSRRLPQALVDLLATLAAAAEDPAVQGVLVELRGAPHGLAQAIALRRALLDVRQRGKPVVAYGEVLGEEQLLVASAATRIWMPETGSLFLVGLRLEGVFLAELLDRLGIRAEVVRIGEYKTAAETFVRRDMSPEQREQLEKLLEDRYTGLLEGLAEGRGLDRDRVRQLVDEGPYNGREAAAAGLVDECLYPDEFEEHLESLTPLPPPERPGPRRVRLVEAPVYHALRVEDVGWWPLFREVPRIGYVVATGVIHRGAGRRGIGSDWFGALLDGLQRDERVVGVVLRVDSPGGDSLASDLLHRRLMRLRERKPLVVSMGEVAASGGYYLAVAGDTVLAEAATVTGSIGVVGGKVNLGGLYQRVGIARESVERGARVGLLSEVRGFTPDERSALRREMEASYDTFLERVAQGRHLSRKAVARVAGGRIFSGLQASKLGLVDGLGGPLEALREVRRRAGLTPDEPALLEVLPRFPFLGGLGGWLGGALGSWRGP